MFILLSHQAFWRSDGNSGEVVTNGGSSLSSNCTSGPLCLVFDKTSANGSPALVAFLGGSQAVEWRFMGVCMFNILTHYQTIKF